ncbi:hypothetical protein BgiMline_030628 [Biomphalaria glabrata]|nr:hypothetical protein BgiMline_027924 [Biomphalaria glabrata]
MIINVYLYICLISFGKVHSDGEIIQEVTRYYKHNPKCCLSLSELKTSGECANYSKDDSLESAKAKIDVMAEPSKEFLKSFTSSSSPSEIVAGVTRSLVVECLLSNHNVTALPFVMSLTLSHSNSTGDSAYTHIATLNGFDSQISGDAQTSLEAQTHGAINTTGDSFLRVTWAYPIANRAGDYRCDAIGISESGKPARLSTTSKVTLASPESEKERIVEKLRNQSILIETLETTLNRTSSENSHAIHDLGKEIQSLKAAVQQQGNRLNQLTPMSLPVLKSMLFTPSPMYNGRRYFLSQAKFFFDSKTAKSNCEYFGGYLAEIDSAEEFGFVKSYFLASMPSRFVYISGTDEAQEKVWVHTHSKTPVRYLNWGGNEPSHGREENCVGYDARRVLVDIPCNYYAETSTYICEIPE